MLQLFIIIITIIIIIITYLLTHFAMKEIVIRIVWGQGKLSESDDVRR